MLHRPQDRVLFVSPHAKMVDVDSIFLKEGQIGIYDTKDTSENGCKAVIDFTGKPRNDKRYEIRIGTAITKAIANEERTIVACCWTSSSIIGQFSFQYSLILLPPQILILANRS